MPNQTFKRSHNADSHNDTISTKVFGVYGELETKSEAPVCHLGIENQTFSFWKGTFIEEKEKISAKRVTVYVT